MYNKSDIKDIYGLSPMQEGMLFHYLKDKNTTAYVQQTVLSIDGEINIQLFKESFDILIYNNDILRTVFIYEKVNEIFQVVLNKRKGEVNYKDISNLGDAEKDEFLLELINNDKVKGFNLSKDVLMRFFIIKVDSKKYKIIWTFHHIIMDGWCNGILLSEFIDIYNNLINNREVILKQKNNFSQYIKWLDKQDKNQALDYWDNYLDGYDKIATLPKKNNDIRQKKNMSYHKMILDRECTEEIIKLSKDNQITINAILQSAWGILLQKYNNTNDVVFGTVVSGRNAEIDGIENTLGLFINTIPIRVKTDNTTSFLQVVRNVNKDLVTKYTYLSIADIQAKNGMNYELFDHALAFENYPMDINLLNTSYGNIGFSINNIENKEESNFDFAISIIPEDDIIINFTYNNNIYDSNLISTISNHYLKILQQVVSNIQINIGNLKILTQKEKKLLIQFNDTEKDFPLNKTLLELFMKQVKEYPHEIAVEFNGEQLTYLELDEKSSNLSRKIINLGIKKNSIIPVYTTHSLELSIAIFSILKCGCTYLPISTSLPKQRIEYILKDSKSNIILTTLSLVDRCNNICHKNNIIILNINENVSKVDENESNNYVGDSEDSAYIIYTSGSTGKPKGVIVQNKSIINFLYSMYSNFNEDISVNDRCLSLTDISFDVSVCEIFLPLIFGATLVFMKEEEIFEPDKISKIIYEKNIDFAYIPPTILEEVHGKLFEYAGALSLNKLLVGVEPIKNSVLKRFLELNSNIQIINGYGPTETTVCATNYKFNGNNIKGKIVPIGKPIGNCKVYILDYYKDFCPIGVWGQIAISGPGVAKGYLNNDELTQKSFITSCIDKQSIMYMTGDIGRWMPDGNIEFLGRNDNQVKVRGYRIELGEIENALKKHNEINTAKVVIRKNKNNDDIICLYYVSKSNLEIPEIRKFLDSKLPKYMLPNYYKQLKEIPITANGKIDITKLPALDINTYSKNSKPTNETERLLLDIWREVLNDNDIEIEDNFFLLGGHSLKATILSSKIKKIFGVNMPIEQIFKAPTIKELAEYISNSSKSIYENIKPIEKKEFYDMSSAQKRLYFLNKFDNIDTTYNMSFMIEAIGNLDISKVEKVIGQIIQRHEILRTSFHIIDEKTVQKVNDYKDFKIEIIESVSNNLDEQIRKLVRPFNLEEAPLLRVGVIEKNEDDHIIIFDMHHIISDGTSVSILINEFIKLYLGEKLELPKIQYKDFAKWQNDLIKNGQIKNQEDYWLEVYKEEPTKLSLPLDYNRPSIMSFEGDHYLFELDAEYTHKFKELTINLECTLYMKLLVAFSILLYKYTSEEDIIVGTPIAGRGNSDLYNTLGMFVNMLPIRNRIKGYKTYEETLIEVRNNCLKAYENQDIQFEDLIEKLNVERDASQNPLFNVSLVVQNFEQPDIELEGVKFCQRVVDNKKSQFDIALDVNEKNDKLYFSLEYCIKLFKKETIVRLSNCFIKLLKNVADNPQKTISQLSIIDINEKNSYIFSENVQYSKRLIPERFQEQVIKNPNKNAIVYKNKSITFKELDNNSNRIANYLIGENNVQPDSLVGILLEKSIDSIEAIMGVLKSGAAYIPMDPKWPEERIRKIIDDSATDIVISSKNNIRLMNSLQWECESLKTFVCLESDNVYSEETVQSTDINNQKRLWEYIGKNSVDEITGGGWVSSYTGEPFTKKEMNEYRDNVYNKLIPYASKNSSVLELGCASGITMYSIAPHIAKYYGTDLSQEIIDKNIERVKNEDITNIHLKCMAAHDTEQLKGEKFDLIIINSVIQDFSDLNYLRKVLNNSIKLLNNKGYIFVGDVMNQDTKDLLVNEIIRFKWESRDKNYKTKTDFSSDLFVSKLFFNDLQMENENIKDIQISEKIHTIKNELSKYRYDVMIEVDKNNKHTNDIKEKNKFQHDKRTLNLYGIDKPSINAKPEHLAYVIYTSGTTGTPKGVMVENSNVINLLNYFGEKFDLDSNTNMLNLTEYTFDPSVEEILGTLIYGGTVFVVDKEQMLDINKMREYIDCNGITILNYVPAYLNTLLTNKPKLNSIKYVISGGEKLEESVKNDILSVGYKLFNNYGPTEITVDGLVSECTKDEKVNIGKPIANTRSYVLDKDMNIVPLGVTGELYISGQGVARGYLKNEEYTKERFLCDPFVNNAFMYKTGDLAKKIPNGNIEYLSRIDNQIKIRGFRIEIQEIETVILKYSGIKEVVVIDREDENEIKFLVAYVVGEAKLGDVFIDNLKEYLKGILPEYMIPIKFTEINEIPYTHNGKVDRSKLDGEDNEADSVVIEPETEVEKTLVNIWKNVLGKENVGITNDFFEIGGDSIKAIQVASKMQEYDMSIEISDIFIYKTIKELSLRAKSISQYADQGEVEGEVQLTPIQEWFFENNKFEDFYYNQSSMIYKEEGFNEQLVKMTLNKLIEHHDALRMKFSIVEDKIIQYNKPYVGSDFQFEVVNLNDSCNEKIDIERKCEEVQASLSIKGDRLLRAILFKTEEGDHLFITIHHLLIDRVSWMILLEDFKTCYNQLNEQQDIKLPKKTTSYRQWAEGLNNNSNSKELSKEIEYWTNIKNENVSLLPKDNKIDERRYSNLNKVSTSLDNELTEKLLYHVNKVYNTEINDILLSSLGIAIKNWCNLDKIMINLEGHGREDVIKEIDIRRTVGWFTSQYPVLIDSSKSDDISYYIRFLKESIRQIPNKGFGYGILKYMNDSFSEKCNLQTEISFNYMGQFNDEKDTFFKKSQYDMGNQMDKQMYMDSAIIINCQIYNGNLIIDCYYNDLEYKEESIINLKNEFNNSLNIIIDHCMNNDINQLTPSDLGDKDISLEELDDIMEILDLE